MLPSGRMKCSSPSRTSPLVTPRIGMFGAARLAIRHCAIPPSTIIKSSVGPRSVARLTNSDIIAISLPARDLSCNLKCLYPDFSNPLCPNVIIAPTGCLPNKCELSKTPARVIFVPIQFSSSVTFLFQSKFCVYGNFWRIPRFDVCVNAMILSRVAAADSKSIFADCSCICFVRSLMINSLFPVKIFRAIRTFSAYFSVSGLQHGALQRPIWYSRQGRVRLRICVSVQVLIWQTFCIVFIVSFSAVTDGYGPNMSRRCDSFPLNFNRRGKLPAVRASIGYILPSVSIMLYFGFWVFISSCSRISASDSVGTVSHSM